MMAQSRTENRLITKTMNRLTTNRLTTNRLTTNRLSTNRLPTNRLPTNRLSTNRLLKSKFANRHQRGPSLPPSIYALQKAKVFLRVSKIVVPPLRRKGLAAHWSS